MFRCSVKKKLEMLGKHGGKIVVGGSGPGEETDGEGDKPDALLEEKPGYKKRNPSDLGPFMMHSPPFTMYEELLHAFDARDSSLLQGTAGRR